MGNIYNISIRFGDRKNLFGPGRQLMVILIAVDEYNDIAQYQLVFCFIVAESQHTHSLTLAHTEGQHNQSAARSN